MTLSRQPNSENQAPKTNLFFSHYILTFEFVDEILKCDHSNESYLAALSCGIDYYAVEGGSNFSGCGVSKYPDLVSSIKYLVSIQRRLLFEKNILLYI